MDISKYNNLERTFIVMVGIPGSGKTTTANKILENNPQYEYISRDKIRETKPNYRYTKEEEFLVKQLELRAIQEAILRDNTIIIDDTNCYIKTRRKLEKLALDNGYRIEYCFLMCTPEKAMKNIEGRDRKVPKEAIDRMYNALMNCE
jgi:predicted kinase